MTLVRQRISLQVSFVQYSDEVKSEFKLNTYNDKAMALGALQNIRYRGGNTRTGTVQHHRCRQNDGSQLPSGSDSLSSVTWAWSIEVLTQVTLKHSYPTLQARPSRSSRRKS